MDEKLIKRARAAKSAKELMSLAKESGTEITEEEAQAYFAQLNKSGELADEELDNVAGGGCHAKDGRLVVTIHYSCEQFVCKSCGRSGKHTHHVGNIVTVYPACEICKYCTHEKGLWLCNNPANIK